MDRRRPSPQPAINIPATQANTPERRDVIAFLIMEYRSHKAIADEAKRRLANYGVQIGRAQEQTEDQS